MWENNFRLAVVNIIYQILFWDFDLEASLQKDWSDFFGSQDLEFLSELNDEDFIQIKSIIQLFFEQKETYSLELQEFLKEWNKTYNLVKSVLYTFLLEKQSFKENPTIAGDLISRYIKLTEEFIGGPNVSLVHAILSSLTK